MQRLSKGLMLCRTNRDALSHRFCEAGVKSLLVLLLAGAMMLSACGGASGGGSQKAASLSGNWQFAVTPPADGSFLGGLQGGFLLQKNGSVTGAVVYSVSLPSQSSGIPTVCNGGSAPITGTVSGQTLALTAVAGTQTFTFTGTLSSDGSTVTGTYESTAGTAADGSPCGTVQTGLQWSAVSVPPLTGSITGGFHSAGGSGLGNRVFPVTGLLSQGENIGASNATVTGTLSFIDPVSLLSDYPCFETATVNGQISGNSVILQIIGVDGSNLGQIGGSTGSGVSTVTFDSTQKGYILHSAVPPAYAVNTKTCPGAGTLTNPGDFGSICLALGSTSACQQPIALSPAVLIFPSQMLGSTATTQTITLTNSDPSGATLSGLTLSWDSGAIGDFTGRPNFVEADNCAASVGATFSLQSGQSCSINVTFTPQQSCPWLPVGSPPAQDGAAPEWCPFPLAAALTVNSPASADNDTAFKVPITGAGVSSIEASTAELDFGAETGSEASLPQLLSFTNHSANPVQILSTASTPCTSPLQRPVQNNGQVDGVRVLYSVILGGGTITYFCDIDPTSKQPNFQISSDTCTGRLLASQDTCSLQVAFVPQKSTYMNQALDYFLELNTLQCSSIDNVTSDCEIDSGRFPVELTANPPSPLRMSPSAGLDFGSQAVGNATVQQTITLFNDPADPNASTLNFVGKVAAKGDYSETDDCPFSLAPGATCTLTVTFKPKVVGFDPGSLTVNYTPEPTGTPQVVHLRGTGQ